MSFKDNKSFIELDYGNVNMDALWSRFTATSVIY